MPKEEDGYIKALKEEINKEYQRSEEALQEMRKFPDIVGNTVELLDNLAHSKDKCIKAIESLAAVGSASAEEDQKLYDQFYVTQANFEKSKKDIETQRKILDIENEYKMYEDKVLSNGLNISLTELKASKDSYINTFKAFDRDEKAFALAQEKQTEAQKNITQDNKKLERKIREMEKMENGPLKTLEMRRIEEMRDSIKLHTKTNLRRAGHDLDAATKRHEDSKPRLIRDQGNFEKHRDAIKMQIEGAEIAREGSTGIFAKVETMGKEQRQSPTATTTGRRSPSPKPKGHGGGMGAR